MKVLLIVVVEVCTVSEPFNALLIQPQELPFLHSPLFQHGVQSLVLSQLGPQVLMLFLELDLFKGEVLMAFGENDVLVLKVFESLLLVSDETGFVLGAHPEVLVIF